MVASFLAELAGHLGRHERVYFPLLSIVLGLLCAALAWGVSFGLARHPGRGLASLRSRPAGMVLGAVCLALGVLGLFAVGAPWYIRALLQAAARRPARAWAGSALLVIFAATLIALPLLARQ